MKTCPCGGDYLRHGTIYYPSGATSVRYICRECRKTITAPVTEDRVRGTLKFNLTGRPTMRDWRHAP